MTPLSIDAWLLREVARTNAATAKLQQEYLKAKAGKDGYVDVELMAEWRGQEIAFNRMVAAADRKEIPSAT